MSLSVIKEYRATRSNPCPICGATDYDTGMLDTETGNKAFWCHKIVSSKWGDQVVGSNGEIFVCVNPSMNLQGEGSVYKELSIFQQEHENWKKSNVNSYSTPPKPLERVDEVKPLSHVELDKRNRFILSKLVLEEWDREELLKEWDYLLDDHFGQDLLKKYPIVSLPPEDRVRFKRNGRYKNITRKQLVKEYIANFGSPEGHPGFFLRTGDYWEKKPEIERWTLSKGEGILFPVYDVDGYLYALRIKQKFPPKSIKETDAIKYNGDYGEFYHKDDFETGEHLWYFHSASSKKEDELVFGKGNQKIELDSKGLPVLGKAQNKYKSFSSSFEKIQDGKIYNLMKKGCSSGSPYSIYLPSKQFNYQLVIGTEGEKKGMVSSQIKNVPVLTVPGVGVYKQLFDTSNGKSVISSLKEKGMKIFILCYDADKAENKNVKKAEEGFIELLKQENILVYKGEWSGSFDKGLDDILLMGLDFSVNLA